MKKILIFYASYGGGHLSAAKSIQEYIENNYTDCETKLVDCVKYINKALNYVTTSAYKEMAKKAPWAWGKLYAKSEKGTIARLSSTSNKIMAVKLNKLLQDFEPDLIISTHFFGSQMCSILKKKGKIKAKIATVLTDYAPHDQWILNSTMVDYFFVAHSGMKDSLIQKGIDENKIYVTGIPLSNRFLKKYNKNETYNFFSLDESKKTFLFFAGGEFGLGKTKTYEIFKTLTEVFKDIQVVAISGKNEKMRKSFKDLVEKTSSENRIKVLPFTDKVPELMSISDFVITKPGGLTTTESLASSLPIIIINPLPGQEEENADFLVNHNVAIWIKDVHQFADILTNLLSSPSKIAEMKANSYKLAKRNSCKDICNILFNK